MELSERQEKILEVFKYFINYCEKENLKYIACGGTVLGAVRHKSFIPWDDDVDVYMPREDYEKLISQSSKMISDGYEVLSIYNRKDYYLPFAKITDRNSTIWEVKNFPMITGVFVDIFPLDQFELSDEEIVKIQNKSIRANYLYTSSLNQYNMQDFLLSFKNKDFRKIKRIIGSIARRPFTQKYYQNVLNFEKKYKGGKGSKSVCVTQWPGKIFQTSWFNDTINLPFYNTTIKIPQKYDCYLKLLYGDYMKLPPIEERKSPHGDYFIDLYHKLTKKEILSLKKR